MKDLGGTAAKPKILIIKLSALGDLFHALPVVHNLKSELNAEIHWVVQKEYSGLVKCFTDVDRVIPFHRKSFFSNFITFTQQLRSEQYDYIIDLQGLLKSAVVATLAKGKTRIGPSFHREGAGFFYSGIAGKRDKNRHAVEENLDVVRYLNLKLIEPQFPVNFPKVNVSGKQPRVAILPESRWFAKNWPAESFAEVIKRLQASRNMSLYIVGSSRNTETCSLIESMLPEKITKMAGKTSMTELGGFLSQMDLLIANDSGPVHMAVAVGTPTLTIFGPTDPVRTGPYGNKKHRVIKTTLSCQPCFSRTCSKGQSIPCIANITPDEVHKAAIDMLNGRVS